MAFLTNLKIRFKKLWTHNPDGSLSWNTADEHSELHTNLFLAISWQPILFFDHFPFLRDIIKYIYHNIITIPLYATGIVDTILKLITFGRISRGQRFSGPTHLLSTLSPDDLKSDLQGSCIRFNTDFYIFEKAEYGYLTWLMHWCVIMPLDFVISHIGEVLRYTTAGIFGIATLAVAAPLIVLYTAGESFYKAVQLCLCGESNPEKRDPPSHEEGEELELHQPLVDPKQLTNGTPGQGQVPQPGSVSTGQSQGRVRQLQGALSAPLNLSPQQQTAGAHSPRGKQPATTVERGDDAHAATEGDSVHPPELQIPKKPTLFAMQKGTLRQRRKPTPVKFPSASSQPTQDGNVDAQQKQPGITAKVP